MDKQIPFFIMLALMIAYIFMNISRSNPNISKTYKYFFTDAMSCKNTSTAELVPIYDGHNSDNDIINKKAKPIGNIIFTFEDLANKCDLFPDGKKMRILNNTIMINNHHSSSYMVNYYLDTKASHFSKGNVFATNVVSKKGLFMDYKDVKVQTKENNIRVVTFTS